MIKTFFIAALFIFLSGTALGPPTVLILHSDYRCNDWTASIGRGMETVLREFLFGYPAPARFNSAYQPKDSLVLNQPHSFYQLNRQQLLAALLIMSLIILALLVDIVLRHRTEKALQNRQARLKAIHDNVAAGIALADPQGRYLEVNERWAEMFGCSPRDIIGRNFLDLTFPDDRKETSQGVRDLLHGKKDHYRLQKRCVRADGTVFWVDNSVTRILDTQGKLAALVGLIIDISEHKRTEDQLQTANRELDAFVRTASHDLRSPLTLIIGFSEYLQIEYRHQLDEQGLLLLSRIEQCGQKMQQLLEDLLAFARVGYVEKPSQPVDTNQIALEVALGHTQTAGDIVIKRNPLPAIHVPKSFLLQVFDNLIGNAVRYAGSAGGPVEVGGEIKGDRVRFFVRDHGPGIEPEERERIFDPFYRGSAGKNIDGTGIGLATVQKIARLYDGKAWLEETPGGGCTFWVEMRDIKAENADTSAGSPPSGQENPTEVPGSNRAPAADAPIGPTT